MNRYEQEVFRPDSYTKARAVSQNFVRGAARGFSLLELMLVMAIIGILIASAAFSVAGAGARAKAQVTRASLSTIKGAISAYNITFSTYPTTLQTLVVVKPPFLDDKKLQDGWSREFMYSPQGRSREQPYLLGSSGDDGIAGNEDDIDVWTMDK